MPRPRVTVLTALVLAAGLALAGCENSERRAERHFNSGVSLMEAGQPTQALLEFRNVLRLQPGNIEARLHVGRIHLEAGDLPNAYREFLQVAERDPDVLEARLVLARLAAEDANWPEAERHGRAAERLAPEDPQVALIAAVLDYREAVVAGDRAGAADPAALVAGMVGEDGQSIVAWQVLIDHALQGGTDPAGALERIEQAITAIPDHMDFHVMRLRALISLERREAIGEALQEMMAQFPEDPTPHQYYVGWLVEQGDHEGATTHLRTRAERAEASDRDRLLLMEFLRQTRGGDAALEEIDRQIARTPQISSLRAMRATQLYELGDAPGAIDELRGLLADPEGSADAGTDVDDLRVLLARFLMGTGATDEARSLVAEVLDSDAGHVEALKMRAAWQIQDDQPTEAITTLRQAQAGAPRDPAIMLMMGQAHEREGARDLAGERFAQAVEMSGDAARESMVYARHLLSEDRLDAAESVLNSALRRSPADLDLQRLTIEVQLRRGAWDRVQRSIWALRSMDMPQATALANAVEADLLLRQGRTADTIGFLEGLVRDGVTGSGTIAALVQTQVMEGRYDGALEIVEERLAQTPDDAVLRFLRAGLHVLAGELDSAEASYRRLVGEFPQAEPPLRALYALLQAQGRDGDAEALIDEVIAASPDALMPRMLRAGRLERTLDIDGAIAIYEELYATDSSNLIVANNLASLISAHREDDASLDRAHAIARRLRGTDVPAFQDTYGWIQFRRGMHAEALSYLEPAAAGLPTDPLVQFHLGMTYHALGRYPEARETLARALEIAGDSPLPQFQRARDLLEEIDG